MTNVSPIEVFVKDSQLLEQVKQWAKLLRWNKPSGRLILLIPAGWSLWLTPNAPPGVALLVLIGAGGLLVSAAGCIANDLWDRGIDSKVSRTMQRPLAKGDIRISTALGLLAVMLLLSLLVIFALPTTSRKICLILALLALPPILIYPSAKRWFAFPQILLAICWGFSVLIPWAASQSNLDGGLPLISCWAATMIWTFGFDTVYAMADSKDDEKLGLKSSVLSLKEKAIPTVRFCYAATCLLLANAAFFAGIGWPFWPILFIASFSMQREVWKLNYSSSPTKRYGVHFQNQVRLGGLLLLGLILGRII